MSNKVRFSQTVAGGEGATKHPARFGSFAKLLRRGKGLRNNRKSIRAKKNQERNEKILEKKLIKQGKTLNGEEDGYDNYGY